VWLPDEDACNGVAADEFMKATGHMIKCKLPKDMPLNLHQKPIVFQSCLGFLLQKQFGCSLSARDRQHEARQFLRNRMMDQQISKAPSISLLDSEQSVSGVWRSQSPIRFCLLGLPSTNQGV